ncbi:MAG: hypothetical protein Q8L80_04935 [Gallionella sp.]|nr:hypothetical protein [Gallionella sp.]
MRLVVIFCIALSVAGCGEKNETNNQHPAFTMTAKQMSVQPQIGSAPVAALAGGEFSYDKNSFINYWSCLGVYPGNNRGQTTVFSAS